MLYLFGFTPLNPMIVFFSFFYEIAMIITKDVIFLKIFIFQFEDSEFYLSLEIVESVLQLSHNLGTKKTQIEIPLQHPIHGGIYSVTIEIIITMAETNATIHPNYCDQANRCHVTVKQTTGNILKLNKNFLIGGIDKFTTFIRSKLYSLSGFNGCLEVSFFILLRTGY